MTTIINVALIPCTLVALIGAGLAFGLDDGTALLAAAVASVFLTPQI